MKLNIILVYTILNVIITVKAAINPIYNNFLYDEVMLIQECISNKGRLFFISYEDQFTYDLICLKSSTGQIDFNDEIEIVTSNVDICNKDNKLFNQTECLQKASTMPSVYSAEYDIINASDECIKRNGKFYYGELVPGYQYVSQICIKEKSGTRKPKTPCFVKDGKEYCGGYCYLILKSEKSYIYTNSISFGYDGNTFDNYSTIYDECVEQIDNMTEITNDNLSVVEESCFATRLGYECCNYNEILYSDDDGDWGVNDNRWCGIGAGKPKVEYCGDYKCCQKCEIVYEDKEGKWGVENDEWCVIGRNCWPKGPN
ncbi:hypothetical protein BCR32DRAFT_233191 [Anaeromyces robustus]|uniref:CBM10 domain-containing protein n=1 Tax=Anaeromyces robustus TaxID=1754192 RepID=A0A1Y1X4S0_9FUNG|nr:hypothetical protein BCR32DRAFT_233191 [Anaeromyces robustus]|eukprot:ORX80820.1 hypothetical protein BCR32DRAFT_233191 [Anaeromyces robustus]